MVRESDKSIRYLIDTIFKNLRLLKNLGEPTEHWETIIIYLASAKLDPNTSSKSEEARNILPASPSLKNFFEFHCVKIIE